MTKQLDLSGPLDKLPAVQTHDGRKVRILCNDAPGGLPVVGLIDGQVAPCAWTFDGTAWGVASSSPWDLIPAPERVERVMYLHRTGSVSTIRYCDVVASARVTFTVGEFAKEKP